MSRRLAERVEAYRRLRVPEIWLEDGKRLRVLCLSGDESVPATKSDVLPQLSPAQLHEFIELSQTTDKGSWIRSVQDWVRRNLLA